MFKNLSNIGRKFSQIDWHCAMDSVIMVMMRLRGVNGCKVLEGLGFALYCVLGK